MKKVYRFNLIHGIEFVEDDGFYYAASSEFDWGDIAKDGIAKATIEGLMRYDDEIKHKDEEIEELEKTNDELTKKLENAERNCSYLNKHIEYIRRCGGKEINHRNNIIEEKDKEIERLRSKLHEEALKTEAYKRHIETLDKENTKSPITKRYTPFNSAPNCSDLYVCTPDSDIAKEMLKWLDRELKNGTDYATKIFNKEDVENIFSITFCKVPVKSEEGKNDE